MSGNKISVCRHKDRIKVAFFVNQFDLVRDFENHPATKEKEIIEEFKAWGESQGFKDPEIVYPRITSLKIR